MAFVAGLFGFIASTILILIFGEIVPQALCSRYALGAGLIYLLKVLCGVKPDAFIVNIVVPKSDRRQSRSFCEGLDRSLLRFL